MKRLVLDIETDSDKSKIWMVVSQDVDTGEVQCHTEASSLKPLIAVYEQVIGHNGIKFDFFHLARLWKVAIPTAKQHDTLILSRLYRPDIEGGHSLEAWGKRLSFQKIDYPTKYHELYPHSQPLDEWNKPDLPLMREYCTQDVAVTVKLLEYLESEFVRLKFDKRAIELEHQVQHIVFEQERTGFLVDERKLMLLNAQWVDEKNKLEEQLVATFPPTTVQLKTKQKVIPFNPGSRQQIADRLMAKGWNPTKHTEKGNIIVDEAVLETIDIPEARLLSRYFLLEKRVSQAAQWLQYVDTDGRIHGEVITNGAVTGRMTHSKPNMAQVPSVMAEYGKECRSIFCVAPGYKLVGIDASGLELRMLAHYMQDDDYIREVCEGDVHTKNQTAAGLPTRNNAKTFIYAFLYGAGPEKIGSIIGKGAKEGKVLISNFLDATPALKALKEKVSRVAQSGSVPGLDGRRIHVRSDHAALNSLLQGAGAVVMKQALVLFHSYLTSNEIPAKIVANVHDEWQVEVKAEYADEVGKLGVKAIQDAGVVLGLRCPLTGEYKIDTNWAGTH